jgi:predicted HicB family RNase H-like nuclease
MAYRGYTADIAFDDEDGLFTGRIAGIRDGVGFHAETVADLRAAFHEAVDDYLEACERIGKAPQQAGSGPVMVGISPEVHRRATHAAERAGKSLDQLTEEALEMAMRPDV